MVLVPSAFTKYTKLVVPPGSSPVNKVGFPSAEGKDAVDPRKVSEPKKEKSVVAEEMPVPATMLNGLKTMLPMLTTKLGCGYSGVVEGQVVE